MNPFDLRGPQFLLFYAVFVAAVLIWLHIARRRGEEGDPPAVDTSDPYLIAALRGGKNHVISVAIVSLVDRGLLVAGDDYTLRAKDGAVAIARWPLEKALLKHFASAQAGSSAFSATGLTEAAQSYLDHLQRLDLTPSPETAARRTRLLLIGAALLLGVSAIKLVVAFQRGRYNVIFLVLLTIFSLVAAWIVTHPRLTARGRRLLGDLQRLLDHVKLGASRIVPGGASIELALLAAVFGLAAVPESSFPYVKKVFPKAASSSSSTTTFVGCGSSCGSGCGGGGGGGGGCGGGGCGGCGGGS